MRFPAAAAVTPVVLLCLLLCISFCAANAFAFPSLTSASPFCFLAGGAGAAAGAAGAADSNCCRLPLLSALSLLFFLFTCTSPTFNDVAVVVGLLVP